MIPMMMMMKLNDSDDDDDKLPLIFELDLGRTMDQTA